MRDAWGERRDDLEMTETAMLEQPSGLASVDAAEVAFGLVIVGLRVAELARHKA